MSAPTPLDGEVTREQVLEETRRRLAVLEEGYSELRRRVTSLEARVARQERQQSARARGGAR